VLALCNHYNPLTRYVNPTARFIFRASHVAREKLSQQIIGKKRQELIQLLDEE
jgi:hypothetical protein